MAKVTASAAVEASRPPLNKELLDAAGRQVRRNNAEPGAAALRRVLRAPGSV